MAAWVVQLWAVCTGSSWRKGDFERLSSWKSKTVLLPAGCLATLTRAETEIDKDPIGEGCLIRFTFSQISLARVFSLNLSLKVALSSFTRRSTSSRLTFSRRARKGPWPDINSKMIHPRPHQSTPNPYRSFYSTDWTTYSKTLMSHMGLVMRLMCESNVYIY